MSGLTQNSNYSIGISPGVGGLVSLQGVLGHLHETHGLIYILLLHHVNQTQASLQVGGHKRSEVMFTQPLSHTQLV